MPSIGTCFRSYTQMRVQKKQTKLLPIKLKTVYTTVKYRARTKFFLCSISTQGKTCFQYRVPCWKYYTGKTLFSLQGWVCSVVQRSGQEISCHLSQDNLRVSHFVTFTISYPCFMKQIQVNCGTHHIWDFLAILLYYS